MYCTRRHLHNLHIYEKLKIQIYYTLSKVLQNFVKNIFESTVVTSTQVFHHPYFIILFILRKHFVRLSRINGQFQTNRKHPPPRLPTISDLNSSNIQITPTLLYHKSVLCVVLPSGHFEKYISSNEIQKSIFHECLHNMHAKRAHLHMFTDTAAR